MPGSQTLCVPAPFHTDEKSPHEQGTGDLHTDPFYPTAPVYVATPGVNEVTLVLGPIQQLLKATAENTIPST
eukprot:822184-Pelagomonas_calceolata.AAC.9